MSAPSSSSPATPMPLAAPAQTPVPMLDLSREWAVFREEAMAAIEEVCSRQHFVLGPPAERFEAAAAEACHVPAAFGCGSGTDALWLALVALGIGPGDAVLTTPFSFYATVSSILRAGAHPLLVDVEEQTFNLSAEALQATLARPGSSHTASRPRPAAIMPVHLYGQPADMDALGSLAEQHGLRIVEDAAQAFGAAWNGRPAGSLGDTAAFSFYPTKNLAAFGDAGMVAARSPEAADRIRALRNHGMRRRYFHDDFGPHPGPEAPGTIGWNSRLDGIQAAVLSLKLRRLPAANRRRRELAALYDQRFRSLRLAADTTAAGIVLPWTDPRATPIFHQYVIRAPRRDDLRAFLAARGIGSEVYYPVPLHLQASLGFLGYKPGDFPVAEKAAAEVLALPIYPELREDEVDIVTDAIRAFYA